MSGYVPQVGDNVRVTYATRTYFVDPALHGEETVEGMWLGFVEGIPFSYTKVWTPDKMEYLGRILSVERLPEPWKWRLFDGVVFQRQETRWGMRWLLEPFATYGSYGPTSDRALAEVAVEAKRVARHVVDHE